jgi:hypothetical protein
MKEGGYLNERYIYHSNNEHVMEMEYDMLCDVIKCVHL